MSQVKVYLFLICFCIGVYTLRNQNHPFSIRVFDVGQGDAVYIRTPWGKALIDGGPNYEISRHLRKESPFGTCNLDLVVLTHPHADHKRGLERLSTYCKLGWPQKSVYKWGDVTLVIFQPCKTCDENNSSIIVLLDYGNFEALFMGDLESEGQSYINMERLDYYIDGPLEVYKVPHHGAKNALNKEFLLHLRPKYCLIPVGKGNMYGHPHQEVLSFLREIECEVLRTDMEGSIEVFID
ncbi:ComEC/Rec2 family competence protein [Patescibacteria group bacterium]